MDKKIIFKNITKIYPGVTALDDISYSIKEGTIIGIAGENGSGKSTLLKLLMGIETPSKGEVRVNSNIIRSTKDSISQKIAMVTQEPSLVEDLSIFENVMIQDRKSIFVNWKQQKRNADKYLKLVGLDLNSQLKVSTLTPDQQQLVSIARALSSEPDILLLDEATSSLSEDQTERIYDVLLEQKSRNKIIIFISHKLKEYLTLCDEVLVLRDSLYICNLAKEDLTEEVIITSMIGRELKDLYPPKNKVNEEINDHFILKQFGVIKTTIDSININVKKGEIFTLAGLVGCGRSEILRALSGNAMFSGEVLFDSKHYAPKSVREAIGSGVSYIPAERKSEGIVGHLSVFENAMIGFRSKNKMLKLVSDYSDKKTVSLIIKKMGVKTPSIFTQIGLLSGGNQQKIILGRALSLNPKLLLLDEPTRGIDVNAKSEIYHILRELTNKGVTVVISTSDLQEVIGISDKVGVLFRGKLTKILKDSEITEGNIMYYATGSE